MDILHATVPIGRWYQSQRSHSPFSAALLYDMNGMGRRWAVMAYDLETLWSGIHSGNGWLEPPELSLSPVAYLLSVLASKKNYLKNLGQEWELWKKLNYNLLLGISGNTTWNLVAICVFQGWRIISSGVWFCLHWQAIELGVPRTPVCTWGDSISSFFTAWGWGPLSEALG